MQTHTLPAGLWHTHTLNLKEEPPLQFRCDSFLIASLLPFLQRRNRFPCSDLIPGSRIWALIRESDASGGRRTCRTEHDARIKGLKTTSSKLDQVVDVSNWWSKFFLSWVGEFRLSRAPFCLYGDLIGETILRTCLLWKIKKEFYHLKILRLPGTNIIFHPSPGWKRNCPKRRGGVKGSDAVRARVRSASLELIPVNQVLICFFNFPRSAGMLRELLDLMEINEP